MAVYLIKNTASGKYVLRTVWDGVTSWAPPVGHTAELETGVNKAQGVTDIAAAFATAQTAASVSQRDIAREFLLNDPRPEMKALRAVVQVLVDEINLLRANVSNTPAASPMPARTSLQALNATITKITSGSAD